MKEPKYKTNICPTCHEPQIGAHYHENNTGKEEPIIRFGKASRRKSQRFESDVWNL